MLDGVKLVFHRYLVIVSRYLMFVMAFLSPLLDVVQQSSYLPHTMSSQHPSHRQYLLLLSHQLFYSQSPILRRNVNLPDGKSQKLVLQ